MVHIYIILTNMHSKPGKVVKKFWTTCLLEFCHFLIKQTRKKPCPKWQVENAEVRNRSTEVKRKAAYRCLVPN